MVNAPPTPPPTTAAELHDQTILQAQASSSLPAPAPPTPQDGLPPTFPLIADLAAKSRYRELIQQAEEIDSLSNANHSPSRLFIVSPLVLTYLILDDIPPAQYALARLPEPLLSLPLTRALVDLVNATIERQYNNVYPRAEALFNLVSQSDFPDAKLASLIANLVTNFTEAFRARTFALLSRAYGSLPLSLAQVYLGLPGDQVLAVATEQGWNYDAPSSILEPKEATAGRAAPLSTANSATSSLSAFKFIASSAAELEA